MIMNKMSCCLARGRQENTLDVMIGDKRVSNKTSKVTFLLADFRYPCYQRYYNGLRLIAACGIGCPACRKRSECCVDVYPFTSGGPKNRCSVW